MAWAIPIAKAVGTAWVGSKVAQKAAGKPPEAPAPLDAAAATQAQAQANTQAAQQTAQINRPDQTTPYGTLKWNQGGNNYNAAEYANAEKLWKESGGTGTAPTKESFGYDPNAWSSTMELNPELQALLEQGWDLSGQTQQNAMGAFGTAPTLKGTAQPNAPAVPTYQTPGAVALGAENNAARSNYNDFSGQANGAADLATSGRDAVLRAMSTLGNNSGSGVDYSGAPKMPTANEDARKQIEQALYSRATARLDPRFNQAADGLNTQLANQGITQGSEAYNREQQNFSMARNDAYSSAMNDAISGSDEALQRLFDMELSARKQGVDEANSSKTLSNQERSIKANEAAMLAQLGLSADDSARSWQQMMDQQEGQMDDSSLKRINAITAEKQRLFGNDMIAGQQTYENQRDSTQQAYDNDWQAQLRDFGASLSGRGQILNELLGTQPNTTPSFDQGGNVSAMSPADIIQALMAQSQGETANYNVGVTANNATQSSIAQMIAALMANSGKKAA